MGMTILNFLSYKVILKRCFSMAHLYEKGQLVIPKYFRDLLGWGKSTEVVFRLENARLVVEKKESLSDYLEAFAKRHGADLKGKVDFDDEADEDREEEAKYRRMGI
ncbi:MAG: AbrB/MazE/SpoVT family DNA-binding domain-containing protein [Candidatus Micrarchaeota archaeon]